MTTTAMAANTTPPHALLPNGTSIPKPLQLSLPLPHAPGTHVHIHLTQLPTTLVLFLTSTHGPSHDSAASVPLGSFVYAMPDRRNAAQPLSTALYAQGGTLDFATRMAHVLARRTGRGVYVGSSVSFAAAAQGGTVEEEMEGFRGVVDAVLGVLGGAGGGG